MRNWWRWWHNCFNDRLENIFRVSSGQGKVREIPYQAKVRELSGNFVMGQGKWKMLWKVREKSGNLERVVAMVVSWVIWNILDNILIHCWWSCWHQWLGSQAPMIHWIFNWCQMSWYTIFPVTIHGNYSFHMKLKWFVCYILWHLKYCLGCNRYYQTCNACLRF